MGSSAGSCCKPGWSQHPACKGAIMGAPAPDCGQHNSPLWVGVSGKLFLQMSEKRIQSESFQANTWRCRSCTGAMDLQCYVLQVMWNRYPSSPGLCANHTWEQRGEILHKLGARGKFIPLVLNLQQTSAPNLRGSAEPGWGVGSAPRFTA